MSKREKRRAFSLGWRWGAASVASGIGARTAERALRLATIRRGEAVAVEPRDVRSFDGLVWLGYRAARSASAGEV